MILAVVGSRGFTNYELLKTELDKIKNIRDIEEIVSGGAEGADKFAEKYAKDEKIKMKIILPDWKNYGKRAGAIRNEQIIVYSSDVIAFWDGLSPGTKITINLAEKYNKPVTKIMF